MKTEPHERVVSGLFRSRSEAHQALDALAPTGIETEDISIITTIPDYEAEEFSELAGFSLHDESIHAVKIGRVIGGIAAGVTALVGMIFGDVALLPAVLIVIAISAFGALLGTVIAAGFTENEWDKLGEAIREGKILVAVHTHSLGVSRRVSQILKDCHAEAVHSH